MSKRRWTIVIVPQGSSASKIIEVSHIALKLFGSLGVAAMMLAMLLGYATIRRSLNLARAERLEHENARLADELNLLGSHVSALTDTMAQLEVRDAQLRLLANVDPIDAQVHKVGIGGPLPKTAVEPPSTELLGRAAMVRVDINALIRRASLLAISFREAGDSLALHANRLAATPSIMPTAGWLSSAFSMMRYHPILHVARAHEGLDVSAPMGTPIEAPAGGVVTSAGWETGYGNTLTIDHGFGIVTKFAHASRLLVRVGQKVERGDRIALVGATGLSTGPHLHYEVHVNGRPVDPRRYILPQVVTD
ncbi:MAG TPA: M23 family metallopeptidase [Gemmatimonadales bacterium]|jgi:murein DD-endopeptidase MepM/ murein hydrolase activator NlpD|nr:M23 family metallopeptidase [Gemmatimonadales bacterium]